MRQLFIQGFSYSQAEHHMHNKKYPNLSIKKSPSNRSVCQDVDKLRRESQQFIRKFQEFQRQNYENFKKIKKKVPHQSDITSSLNEQIHHFRTNLNTGPQYSRSISKKQKKNRSRNSIDSKTLYQGIQNHKKYIDVFQEQFSKENYKVNVKNIVDALLSDHQSLTLKNFNDILKRVGFLSKKINRLQDQAQQLKQINRQVKGRRNKRETLRQKYQISKISNEEIKELKEQISLLEKQNKSFKAQITILKMENDQIKTFRENDSTYISELIQKLSKKQMEITTLSKQIYRLKETKLNLDKKFNEQKQKLTKQLSNERSQNTILEQKIHTLQMRKLTFMESEIIDVDKMQEKEEDIELKMRQQISFLAIENDRLKSENQRLKSENQRHEQELSQRQFEYEKIMNRVSELEFKQNTMLQSASEQALFSKKLEETSLAKEIANYEKIQKIQNQISELSQELRRKEHSQKSNISSILNSLRDLRKNLPKMKKKESGNSYKQVGSSLTETVNKEIRDIKESIEEQMMKEEDIRNSIRDIFKIQVIEYEIKGYRQIFNEIKNEIDKKNKKISKQEQNNLILEKDLKKAQLIIQNWEKEHKEDTKKNSRSFAPVRDKSNDKIKGSDLIKFQKQIAEKRQIIEMLHKQIQANQNQSRSIKSNLQAEIQSLQSENKINKNINNELYEQINRKQLEKQQQSQQIQKYKRKIKQLNKEKQEIRNTLIRKQSENRKQSIENAGKLKKQESKAEKLQSELTRERESRNQVQKYYESIIEDKKKVIDELFHKQSQFKLQIRVLNEKINQILLQNEAYSQKKDQKPKKLHLAHPQSMNLSFSHQSSKNISQLEKQLQKSEQKIIELELQKRKLNRLLNQSEQKAKGQQMLIQQNNFSKMLQEEIRHQRKIRQDLEVRIKVIEGERLNLQMKITARQSQIENLQQTIVQLNNKNQQNIFKLKEDEKKERELIRIIENLKEQRDEDIEALQKQHAQTNNKKDQELTEYIQKYNDAKIQLFQKLDCKSDQMQDIQIKYQNEISLLKEHIELLQAKINNTMIKSQNNSREEQSKTIQIPNKFNQNDDSSSVKYVSSVEVSDIRQSKGTLNQEERENSNNLKSNQDYYEIEDDYHQPRFGQIQKNYDNLDDDEEPIDESQLADEVWQLNFQSPLEARIVVEEDDGDEVIKGGGFNLGLMQMMGDDNENEEVIDPDD